MDTPIRILHVVGRMDRGGTEALLMNLLRTIDRTKIQYDFVEQTQDVCDYDEEIRALGGIIYRCPHISLRNLRQYRLWWRTFFRQHPQYRIIHGHSRGSAPVYLAEARSAGRITIAHCHGSSCGSGLHGIIRWLWQLPLRHIADYNFACSRDAGISQFGRHGRFRVIKNGIQTDRFAWDPALRRQQRQRWGLTDRFVVGNVARFDPRKNHGFLLEIFREVKKCRPEAILFLAGEGETEAQIRRLAEKMGLGADVIFAGTRSDVHALMQAMDVFLLPSDAEGFGIVNVEAQAAGLPCFVTEKAVPAEVKLTDLVHFIPPEQTAAQWAAYILAHAGAPHQRRDGSRAVQDAGYDIRATARELNHFYLEVLKNE